MRSTVSQQYYLICNRAFAPILGVPGIHRMIIIVIHCLNACQGGEWAFVCLYGPLSVCWCECVSECVTLENLQQLTLHTHAVRFEIEKWSWQNKWQPMQKGAKGSAKTHCQLSMQQTAEAQSEWERKRQNQTKRWRTWAWTSQAHLTLRPHR